ncbi:citryl-CoA lyase [Agrobacterium larrymoorei]|uniref:citrate synthase (unknown stereospecificity) n=1 Tax=Agrobacterium larrymoorei TaxID=160699 RepID=A0AAF0HG23_9HYPH|nr:citryl-CoA lyase [Agrobacterium larrymoorei]WHA44109.1 citryl-CoA lyase [Agrobacterium larrymoorei]
MDHRIEEAIAWWTTSIIDIAPGKIDIRGRPIAELIGAISFSQMIWLMLRGDMPTPQQASLLEAALVASVDHGPQAPSISIARMATTCGVGLNNAVASAVNVLGDVHGGAGQDCLALYQAIETRVLAGETLAESIATEVGDRLDRKEHIPGFGHRFHPIDPRAPVLLGLVDQAKASAVVSGRFAEIGTAVETFISHTKARNVPMNIDGATAVIFGELGFEAPLARGLFILSRSVGILAHAWEQKQQGGRIKGPMPPSIPFTYTGEATISGGKDET